ncbi:hypothetical protein AX16_002914 [Volvariella volvacea WC 439]|nr:hypothetical protein AX16_002914 [Volvariella volvacea WC 439]
MPHPPSQTESQSLKTKPLAVQTLIPLNTSQTIPSGFPFSFQIPPSTDLWRKPPSTISDTQPTFYTALYLSELASASVVVSIKPEILYDQVGLVLLFPSRPDRWIKAGVEYEPDFGGLKKSCVVTREWSDWGISDINTGKNVRISVERERLKDGSGKGPSLLVKVNGEVVREITWVFSQEDEGVREVWVGFYGARPAKVDHELTAVVEEFGVEAWDNA